jgi:hypothetical protein
VVFIAFRAYVAVITRIFSISLLVVLAVIELIRGRGRGGILSRSL